MKKEVRKIVDHRSLELSRDVDAKGAVLVNYYIFWFKVPMQNAGIHRHSI